MGEKRRILVLDEELPCPPDTGKRIRTASLLARLAGQFDISVLVHQSGADPERLRTAAAMGLTVHVAPSCVPPKRGPLFLLRIARNLVSPLPYTVASHVRPAFRRTLDRLMIERRPQLIHIEWTPYATYLDRSTLPAVIAAHNIESRIWERLAAAEAGALRRAFLRLQARRMLAFEQRVFAGCRFATAVSREDAAVLAGFGCPRVAVVDNGVDASYFAPCPDAVPRPRSLVFTGSMDWRANQDAIRWFAEEIDPLLLRRGAYTLDIVGRNPPQWLRSLSRDRPALTFTGGVPDVRPYLAGSAVAVVPLRVGGGSRLKVLEALAMGRPVVSTSIGMEGLDLSPEQHVLIGDTPAAMCAQIERLWSDAALRQRLAGQGRERVIARYEWSSIADQQAALWLEAAG